MLTDTCARCWQHDVVPTSDLYRGGPGQMEYRCACGFTWLAPTLNPEDAEGCEQSEESKDLAGQSQMRGT